MTGKEFLEGIVQMRRTIANKKAKIDVLREIATNTSTTLTGMPRNPSPPKSAMAEAVCKMIDLENEIQAIEQKLDTAIEHLSSMEESDYCTVLLKRYVQEKTWEDIATEMCYSRAHVFRIHTAAIPIFEEHLKMRLNETV